MLYQVIISLKGSDRELIYYIASINKQAQKIAKEFEQDNPEFIVKIIGVVDSAI